MKGACRVLQMVAARSAMGGDGPLGSLLWRLPKLQERLCLPVDEPREEASREVKAAYAGEGKRRAAKVRRGPRWERGRDPSCPWVRPRRHCSPGCTYCQPWLAKKPWVAHCIREEIDVGLWDYAVKHSPGMKE